MVELRVDHLANDERLYVRKFPELAGLPCILTIPEFSSLVLFISLSKRIRIILSKSATR